MSLSSYLLSQLRNSCIYKTLSDNSTSAINLVPDQGTELTALCMDDSSRPNNMPMQNVVSVETNNSSEIRLLTYKQRMTPSKLPQHHPTIPQRNATQRNLRPIPTLPRNKAKESHIIGCAGPIPGAEFLAHHYPRQLTRHELNTVTHSHSGILNALWKRVVGSIRTISAVTNLYLNFHISLLVP